jgi:uncharacterized damage-inducible protein DinB
MKKLLLAMLLCCTAAFAQDQPKPPANPGELIDRQVSMLESELVPLAEAMPAEKFDFAPTTGEFKGVRTFAQQVKHVASVNNGISAALLGEKLPFDFGKGENGPEDIKTKDQIVQYLKDSFAKAHKAAATLTEKNAMEVIDGPFGGKSARLGPATALIWHGFDHYGQMAVYLRMNGIIPPASRKQ